MKKYNKRILELKLRGEFMEKANKKQTFMEGVLTLFIAQLVIKILGLVYRMVITNVDGFGDEGNGLYGAGYQIYTLLLAIASLRGAKCYFKTCF